MTDESNWRQEKSQEVQDVSQLFAVPTTKLLKKEKNQKQQLSAQNWSKQEDQLLDDLIKYYGENWKQIQKFFPTRTAAKCQKRWQAKHNPQSLPITWTKEQDEQIYDLYQSLRGKWSIIATHFPGRPKNVIKSHYYSSIRPRYKRQVWKFQTAMKKWENYLNRESKIADAAIESWTCEVITAERAKELQKILIQVKDRLHRVHSNMQEVISNGHIHTLF